jgi:hypothetical protein
VTAVLGVHSQITGVFEPWNDRKKEIDSGSTMNYDEFVGTFLPAESQSQVLVVKETATDLRYLDRLNELLLDSPKTSARDLVLIFRNPFHVFLSEIQARRDWWGAPEARPDAPTFAAWARRTIAACAVMAQMAKQHRTLLLAYEGFTKHPEALLDLTRAIGLTPEPAQHEFERHLNRVKVRGDISVGQNPRGVSNASVRQRAKELGEVQDALRLIPEYDAIARLAEGIAQLPPLSRAENQTTFIDALSLLDAGRVVHAAPELAQP